MVARALTTLREETFPWGRVTASAGVAGWEKGMGVPDVLVARADGALYRAKAEGRDRVALAPSGGREGATAPVPRFVGAAGAEGVRVLLVDDDPASLHGVGRLLKRLGYMVYSARDPRRALALAVEAAPPFDVLVTDLIMPEMSGFTLVERMEEAGLHFPVLYMSGYVQGEVGWGGAPGLRFRFLEKPMALADLTLAMEELLGPVDTPPLDKPASSPAT